MFVLSTKGTVTEPGYFRMFNNVTNVLHVKVIKNKGSGPITVFREMKRYLPNYDKGLQPDKMVPGISEAIRRAEIKDTSSCMDWPRNTGTTVYRLVKSLRKTGNE